MTAPVLAVHDGSFHADDVFAVSILRLIFPEASLIRSRDREQIDRADFRLDVGGAFNPATGDFDHHQSDFHEKRANGIPYATAGLIWREFGTRLSLSERQVKAIDERLIQLIDANDSGHTLPWDEGDLRPFTVSRVVESFNPSWDEREADPGAAFEAACLVAIQIIRNEIKKVVGREKARILVEDAIRASSGLHYIVLEAGVPWQEVVIDSSSALFVVHPASNGSWRLRAVPIRAGGFELRRPLPDHWAGKQGEELVVAATGVADSIFCHKSRFLAATGTREGAELLARKALEQ